MKALLIGGTGVISTAISQLAAETGMDLTILNRGNNREEVPESARLISADIHDEDAVRNLFAHETFDVVANFINYVPAQVERDIRLFAGKTGQYIFISSASAYQKPMSHYLITESTPLANPYWQYSRDKIACENLLLETYRETGFPVTIVRPSHTYSKMVPLSLHGTKGAWSVLQRMLQGKPVIVHGDGLSLWTFTHSRDFAKGFVGLMGNPHAIGEAVHITSDETLTWNAAMQIVGHTLGVEPKIVHISSDLLAKYRPELLGGLIGDKANSVVFDNSKIKRMVPGFTAAIRFDQGAKMAWDYMQTHSKVQQADPEFDEWTEQMLARVRQLEG